MKKKISFILLIALSPVIFILTSFKSSKSYLLTKVKVECITQCDFTGSDQVYVTIPISSINSKTSATRSFKPGNSKDYTEIGSNSNSGTTAWFVKPGDKIQVFEKDLVDPDDLICEIKLITAHCNGQQQVITGVNGSGKYKIYFTIIVIG